MTRMVGPWHAYVDHPWTFPLAIALDWDRPGLAWLRVANAETTNPDCWIVMAKWRDGANVHTHVHRCIDQNLALQGHVYTEFRHAALTVSPP